MKRKSIITGLIALAMVVVGYLLVDIALLSNRENPSSENLRFSFNSSVLDKEIRTVPDMLASLNPTPKVKQANFQTLSSTNSIDPKKEYRANDGRLVIKGALTPELEDTYRDLDQMIKELDQTIAELDAVQAELFANQGQSVDALIAETDRLIEELGRTGELDVVAVLTEHEAMFNQPITSPKIKK